MEGASERSVGATIIRAAAIGGGGLAPSPVPTLLSVSPPSLSPFTRYPRLLLENRIYCSKVFRKLHIEVAHRQDGLHVLHAVRAAANMHLPCINMKCTTMLCRVHA